MNTISGIVLAALGIIVSASLVWRFAARRRELPCPPWLDFFLENPIAFAEATKQIGRARLRPGMWVLDIGCGTGRIALPAAKAVGRSGQVLAVDVQGAMLRKVEARAHQDGLDNLHTLLAAVGEKAMLEKDAYDCAFPTTVLGEMVEREKALLEIFTALKPGGILSVTEVIVDPHYQSQKMVCRLAKGAGFELKETYGNVVSFTLHFIKPGPSSSSLSVEQK